MSDLQRWVDEIARAGADGDGPLVHLDDLRDRAACGVWSKDLTRSASVVNCPDCKKTWLYAEACRQERQRRGRHADV